MNINPVTGRRQVAAQRELTPLMSTVVNGGCQDSCHCGGTCARPAAINFNELQKVCVAVGKVWDPVAKTCKDPAATGSGGGSGSGTGSGSGSTGGGSSTTTPPVQSFYEKNKTLIWMGVIAYFVLFSGKEAS